MGNNVVRMARPRVSSKDPVLQRILPENKRIGHFLSYTHCNICELQHSTWLANSYMSSTNLDQPAYPCSLVVAFAIGTQHICMQMNLEGGKQSFCISQLTLLRICITGTDFRKSCH